MLAVGRSLGGVLLVELGVRGGELAALGGELVELVGLLAEHGVLGLEVLEVELEAGLFEPEDVLIFCLLPSGKGPEPSAYECLKKIYKDKVSIDSQHHTKSSHIANS